MRLPIEIINQILCYAINEDNYRKLLLLSKDIYNYFGKYYKPLLKSILDSTSDMIINTSKVLVPTKKNKIYESCDK